MATIIKLGTYTPPKQGKPTPTLKKFLVHFRRPSDYQGEYGFDWLRDEYIYPLDTVAYDNRRSPLATTVPLCINVNALKQEYRRDVKSPIAPYGQEYFPAWLSIFPHTTTKEFAHGSTMHKKGVNLDLQFDELETMVNDDTEIIFESNNPYLKITPKKFFISDVLGQPRKARILGGHTIPYYKLSKKINIKCEDGVLNSHEEIKVFAKLENQKAEVGKLMVYKNDVIPKMNLVMVNVITNLNSLGTIQGQRIKTCEYDFKQAGFNQALIRSEVNIYNNFDINSLPNTDRDVINFKQTFIQNPQFLSNPPRDALGQTIDSTGLFLSSLIKLYNKFGKFKPAHGIDANDNKSTFLFFTEMNGGGVRGTTDCTNGNARRSFTWGNAYAIFQDGLINRRSILHEAGHSMGLQHTFSSGDTRHGLPAPPHTFYQGYTDNIMDYTWQVVSFSSNPFDTGDKMRAFFKWQWDILRKDRSLIFNY